MKEDAIKFYKEQSKYRKVPIREIAQKFGVTERTINNWLKPYKQKAKETRIDQIQRFYYEEKRTQEEIAQILGVSNKYVHSVLALQPRKLEQEKINRKEETKKRNREYNTNYKRNNMSESQRLKREENKRRAAEDAIIMNILKKNQEANAISMSIKSKITDDQIVENNIQEYNCVPKRNGNGYVLVLRDEIRRMRPNDLPERINASKGINVNIKTYHEDR
ncbi:helix-turn-helix domain-containing protein [Clostridium baratii]|uniref:helix-turn-helix domain-containing protein n=1 Tax=Clostridium baratii TaxID=1561 RepID=UPI0005F281CC|nr:helix-turn-helix domain-containing protein [Clostridium baratii]AQM58620.1 hypothetical protein NPD11_3073 [Clostridium baratii]KJU70938.1 hypothetical protein UC77_12260 [Clostridium baratii]